MPTIEPVIAQALPLDPPPDNELGRLYAYWLARRGGDALPELSAVQPERMAFMLGRINLVEVTDDPRRYRYRLVGSIIGEAQGIDLHGRWTTGIRPDAYRRLVEAHFADAYDRRAACLHEITLRTARVSRRYWRIILPFRDEGGAGIVLMTGTRYEGRIQDVLDSDEFRAH